MAAFTTWRLFFYCLTSFFFTAEAFGVLISTRTLSKPTRVHLHSFEDQDIDLEVDCNVKKNSVQRRTFLQTVSLAGLAVATAQSAHAFEVDLNRDISTGNFDCLLDLPPITPGCARLYLCRHGQTENNRLRLMQGARVDPEINKNGYEQAERLGFAVGKLIDSDSILAPTLVAHSKLLRAKETATILTDKANSLKGKQQSSPLKLYGEVSSLAEVDFGNLDGKEVNAAKAVMMSTFASWATGDIDRRAGGEGESGREGKNNEYIFQLFVLTLNQH